MHPHVCLGSGSKISFQKDCFSAHILVVLGVDQRLFCTEVSVLGADQFKKIVFLGIQRNHKENHSLIGRLPCFLKPGIFMKTPYCCTDDTCYREKMA